MSKRTNLNTWLVIAALFLVTPWACESAFAGSLVGWGGGWDGQANVPDGDDFVAIDAGFYHSLALKSDGSLVAWGANYSGQTNVPDGNDFVTIAASYQHNLAVKSDGSLVGWGSNNFGQTNVPVDNDYVAVAGGYGHSLALKSDGSIVGWGCNFNGQATPPADNDFVAIAAAGDHSLALKSDGSLVGWGKDYFPYGWMNVPTGSDFVAIAAGGGHALALKSDGSIVGWRSYGVFNVPDGNDFVAIAAEGGHCLALKSDGSIVGWGWNPYGQATPPAGNDFVAIATGFYHSLAIAEPPELVLINPNGGEILLAGETHNITWQSWASIGDVMIEYSTNNGSTWREVDPPNTGNTGSYDWLVPKANSNQCLVRVSEASNPSIFDTSNITFRIRISGQTIFVDANATGANDGSSWADAYTTIQEAIDAALPGDTVLVAAGRYAPSTNGEVFPITMKNRVSLQGAETDNCILDAEKTNKVIYCSGIGSTTKIEGFTIVNGFDPGVPWFEQAGGIFCGDSNPIITNNTITGNSAGRGGGISCWEHSSPTITNNTITENSASYYGGGIFCDHSSPIITNNTITLNSSGDHAGGIYCYSSNPTITNNTVTGNSTHRYGGAFYCTYTSATIANNAITGNSASYGGGIYCYHSSPTTTNNTITGNIANCYGGGIFCREDSNPTIANNTITGNTAGGGGGIYCRQYSYPTITYDNVWGNSGGNYMGCGSGTGCISADPMFVDPTIGDYHLQPDSPCIDAGDNTAVPSDTADLDGDGDVTEPIPFDLDGNQRILDGDGDDLAVVDMGAFEYIPYNTPVGNDVTVIPIDPETGDPSPFTLNFEEVTAPGDTTASIVTGFEVPAGFRLIPSFTGYDITTTAEYSGTITIAINYDDSEIEPWLEPWLMLFHQVDGSWVNITTQVDTVNNIIYGETTSLSLFAVMLDIAPPVLTCPDDIAVSGGFGGAEVTYDPTATDECDANPAVTTDIASGSFFETGVTTVTATAADTSGNLSTCAFDVIVSCFGINEVKIKTEAGKKGDDIKIKGTFKPGVPIDLMIDDVMYTIDDGQGHVLEFFIPAGSFEIEGKPEHQKFKFDSPKGSEPDIKAKFDFGKCEFEFKAKKVAGIDEITSTSLEIILQAGANIAQEIVELEVKGKKGEHLEYKRKPKLNCCPKCKGITLLEVTSDQGVFVYEPEPGKDKLKANTVVDDGVNGPVTIHTSCSKPLDIGDVFGAYTVTDLVKIFDDG